MNGDLSQATLKNNEKNEVQSLKNIKQLQAMEQDLYNKLEADIANNANPEEQLILIQKINQLSDLRINLFKSLENTYNTLQSSVANSRVDLVDQLTVVGIVENELNTAKSHLNQLNTNKHNKMRMVQVNTYYGKRYKAHTRVIKKLIFICVPLLILAILKKKGLIPPFIPDSVIYGISALIIFGGGYSLVDSLIDIYSRDNMDYDAYNWNFNPNNVKSGVYEYDRTHLSSANDSQTLAFGMGLGCVGASCCSHGMVYDHSIQKCIEQAASGAGAASASPMASSAPEPFTVNNDTYSRI